MTPRSGASWRLRVGSGKCSWAGLGVAAYVVPPSLPRADRSPPGLRCRSVPPCISFGGHRYASADSGPWLGAPKAAVSE